MQDQTPPPKLEQLIPDEAIENPERWAEDAEPATPAEPATGEQDGSGLAPDSPLDPEAGLTLGWPDDLDLVPPPPLEPREGEEQLADTPPGPSDPDRPQREGEGQRVRVEVGKLLVLEFANDDNGHSFPQQAEFVERFRALSTIQQLSGEDANVAQLAARAREDEVLLERLLRNYGYYDSQVIRSLGERGAREEGPRDGGAREDGVLPPARFVIIPGERYRFGAIDLGLLADAPDAATLRAAFEILTGDPLSNDRIVHERADLDRALGESGYPFATIAAPELLIDHERMEGDLAMPVDPRGKYVFDEVTSNLPQFLSGSHIARIARFEPGDTYQRSLETDLRQAIIATGLVSTVSLAAREVVPPADGQPGRVAVDVTMVPAKARTIAGGIGYGSDDGLKVQASWEHRNLFPPEGALKARVIAGTREQLAGVSFTRRNFRARDQLLILDAYASNIKSEAVDARTVALRGTFERISNLLFQKPFSWELGAEALYTDERNRVIGGIARPRQTYRVGALFGRATIDATDSLLDPSTGYRLSLFVSPEFSRSEGSNTFYERLQADASVYQSVGEGVVLAARTRFATIQGARTLQIAPSRRLYAGGASSVRGFGYQAVGPRNDLGEPTGGRSLVEFSAEARIRTGLFDGALSVVPFFDLGAVSINNWPDFHFVKYGAGAGIRYDSGFGPIRVDLGIPLNRDKMFDSAFAVYVSLGQAF